MAEIGMHTESMTFFNKAFCNETEKMSLWVEIRPRCQVQDGYSAVGFQFQGTLSKILTCPEATL